MPRPASIDERGRALWGVVGQKPVEVTPVPVVRSAIQLSYDGIRECPAIDLTS
jgi:hypothetical protein